jgi:hypothetical protein
MMAPRDPIQVLRVRDGIDRLGVGERLRWVVAAREDLDAGGVVATVAEAGTYRKPRPLLVSWNQLDEWEVGGAVELLGRRLLRHEDGLVALPRMLDGPRPVLLAHSPSRGAWGARALEGASGERLASVLGTSLPAILETFDTVNLLAHAEDAASTGRRRLEGGILDGRLVVVVGRDTADAIGGRGPLRDLSGFGGTLVGVVAHPSGRDALWERDEVKRHARGLLIDAIVASRGLPAGWEGGPRPDDAVREARLGRGQGWRDLADLGVVSHSPAIGAAWSPRVTWCAERRAEVEAMRRRWRDAEGVAVAEDGRVELRLRGPGVRRVHDVGGMAVAVLLAELESLQERPPWREAASGEDTAWR